MQVNVVLMAAIVMSCSIAIEARDRLKLGIKTSMNVEEQLERLQGIGFDCDPRRRDASEHWQCARSSQLVNLSPRRILLACTDDTACWPETDDLVREIAPKSAATMVKPVTLYQSQGTVHLHCATGKGDQSVCVQSWASTKRSALKERFVWRSVSSVKDRATAE